MAIHWRKRIYVFVCACAYLSFLLVFMGLVSSTWSEVIHEPKEYANYGLLAKCTHNYTHVNNNTKIRHDCEVIRFGDRSGWINAARVFALSSTILLFTVTPVSCYLYFEDDQREDVLILTVYGIVTGFVGLLGAILYSEHRPESEGALSWGYAFFVTGHVIAVLAFLIICVSNYCCRKKKPTVKPYYM